MLIKVILPLVTRIGGPYRTFQKGPILLPGEEIQVQQLVQGENINGDNNQWYFDGGNKYYWSGGTSQTVATVLQEDPSSNYPWWIKNGHFDIRSLWLKSKGGGMKIAVVDSGIANNHPEFDYSKINGKSYLKDNSGYLTDLLDHGSHCAGIMVAKGIESYGLAPDSSLFVAQVIDASGTPDFQAVLDALMDIYNEQNGADKVDIVSMSFSLMASTKQELALLNQIKDIAGKLKTEKSILLVSAAGDDGESNDNEPASWDPCISVGSITSAFVKSSFSSTSLTLDIMAPGDAIKSTVTGGYRVLSGTSMSAAYISGVLSVLGSYMKSKGKYDANILEKTLLKTAINNNFSISEYGHGIVDPNSAFNNLGL
jgi:subtilisin family serine protease